MTKDNHEQESERQPFEEENPSTAPEEVNPEEAAKTPEEPGAAETESAQEAEVRETAIEPVVVDRPQEEQKRTSGFQRVLNFFFGRDTRLGRVLRPALRVLALVVGMLALGLLAGYFFLYRPLVEQRDQALAEIQRLNLEVENTRASLEDSQAQMQALERESQANMEALQAENQLLNFRVHFLIVKNDVLRARMALLDEKNGPGGPTALAALNELEGNLEELSPYVEEVDPVLADLLASRLQVVRGEFARDAQQARVELESFFANLVELEGKLFQEE